jgi:hypothetical protein
MSSGAASQVLKLIEQAEMTAPQIQDNSAMTGLVDAELYNGIAKKLFRDSEGELCPSDIEK